MQRIGVVFVSFGLFFASPASAEVLFVCGNPNASKSASPRVEHALRDFELQPVSAMPRPEMDGDQIALLKGEDGFDLLINWNQAEEFSVREMGASVVANAFGTDFVHLLVAYSDEAAVEHFIFAAEPGGFGTMMWTQGLAGEGTSANGGALESSAMCVTP